LTRSTRSGAQVAELIGLTVPERNRLIIAQLEANGSIVDHVLQVSVYAALRTIISDEPNEKQLNRLSRALTAPGPNQVLVKVGKEYRIKSVAVDIPTEGAVAKLAPAKPKDQGKRRNSGRRPATTTVSLPEESPLQQAFDRVTATDQKTLHVAMDLAKRANKLPFNDAIRALEMATQTLRQMKAE
jgi:hypothetical protein